MKWFLSSLFVIAVTGFTYAAPIQLHPDNPHYFTYKGHPTILITSAEHYGAVVNLDFNYERYLDTLAADGMNYTRIFTGAYFEKPGAFGIEKNTLAPAQGRVITPWARSEVAGAGDGGNQFDLETWNDAYFKRLHDFIAKAEERGIIVEVTLFSSIYDDQNWNLIPFNPKNNINQTSKVHRKFYHTLKNGNIVKYQEALVRKIVRELNEYDNIFFEIQNEPYADLKVIAHFLNPNDDQSLDYWKRRVDLAPQESLAWQEKMVSIITEEEKDLPKTHLIAQNYCNYLYPLKEVNPKVSILNFHYAWPEAVHLNYGWDKVIGFDESGFAGSADTTYRQMAWKFILAGGGLFNNLDYSFTAEKEDGTASNDAPGGGSSALREQLKILQDFMSSFDFIAMEPANHIVKHAPGAFYQCLASDEEAAVYLTGTGQTKLRLEMPQGTYQVEWLDPVHGEIMKQETTKSGPTGLVVSSPNFEEEIAVRIQTK